MLPYLSIFTITELVLMELFKSILDQNKFGVAIKSMTQILLRHAYISLKPYCLFLPQFHLKP